MNIKHIFLTTVICFSFCCKEKSSDIDIDSTIVNFYADSLVLSEEVKISGIDSTTFSYKIDSLYQLHSISREKVNIAIENYKKNLPTWKNFYEMLVKRLEYLRTHK